MKSAHRAWHLRLWLLIGPAAVVAILVSAFVRPRAPQAVHVPDAIPAGDPPAQGEAP